MRAYLTVTEAASILGCHYETVQRLFDAGVLTGWRNPQARGWRRIDPDSVTELQGRRRS